MILQGESDNPVHQAKIILFNESWRAYVDVEADLLLTYTHFDKYLNTVAAPLIAAASIQELPLIKK